MKLHDCCFKIAMQKERTLEQLRLIELNKRFLAAVESGADWKEVKLILDDMREAAKEMDRLEPAVVLSINDYTLNKTGQPGS